MSYMIFWKIEDILYYKSMLIMHISYWSTLKEECCLTALSKEEIWKKSKQRKLFSSNFCRCIILSPLQRLYSRLETRNLLLYKNGNIRIADFGMQVLESKGSLVEKSCGSPHFASHEIVAGKTRRGTQSDIWSCRIILFVLLT